MMDMIQDFMDYINPILPHVILIIAALIAPAIGMKSGKASAVFMLAAGLLALGVTACMMYNGYSETFEGLFAFNEFTGFMILLFMAVFCLIVAMSYGSSDNKKHHGEYYSLLAAATVGMMFVCAAQDLISLFVGLELAGIMSIALVAFKKNDPRSSEAAVKYLIISGLSTALFLYGMSLVYGLTGTLNIHEIIYGVFDSSGVQQTAGLAELDITWAYAVAMVTMIAGFAFKIAIIPFHAWAPDVYEGAPTPVATFLAIGSKKMGFVVFFKIFLLLFVAIQVTSSAIHELQWVFAILAAATMTLGNIVAISQTNIKRMLAYSSIAQGGYILIVLAVASELALVGGLFHMFTHVFMKGGAFIVVAALCARGIGESINDYRGLSKRAPLIAFAMMLFMFSLAGIPFLAGFWSKFILFSSAVDGGTWIWLVAFAVINSAISLYYYTKVVKAMYVDKGATTEKLKVPFNFKIAIAVCAIATIAMGVYPGPIIELCEMAARTLLL
ncbi:MAG: NADH-quinone oxidoreductase subunit N [Methanomassiliicoccaceae archaeon]|jgi:NADH-quinone oxidoreductase subunit N|nr:NADH-quinone oxidoreductase subunit N [Methanomassiliicoccaceae archaeon]